MNEVELNKIKLNKVESLVLRYSREFVIIVIIITKVDCNSQIDIEYNSQIEIQVDLVICDRYVPDKPRI